jgi:hypothetical protein
MDIHSIVGTATKNIVGDFGEYGTVWYHPQGIANILSLVCARDKGYQVTYDIEKNVLNIHKHNESTRMTHQSPKIYTTWILIVMIKNICFSYTRLKTVD